VTASRAKAPSAAGLDESGFTLIEIAIVLFVLAVLIPLIATFIETTQKYSYGVASRTQANSQAQVIDEYLSRQVHAINYPLNGSSGSDILTATATEFQFYSSLGATNGPTQVDIKAVAACSGCSYYSIQETTVTPGGSPSSPSYSSGAVTATRTLGTGIVLPATPATNCPSSGSSIPLFEYFSTAGNTVTPGTCLQTSSTTLTTAQFSQVDSVTVSLTTLDAMHTKSSPQPLSTFTFSMPNVAYLESNA
jgi:prepilin-type N-terminal cleavage/methylation domain-containing protein